jgi:hypothetical protein
LVRKFGVKLSKVWESLSFFESLDLIRRRFKSRHHEDLPANKAREIVAHLTQGREYFRSADGATDLIRPLLLYYGALALTRALVLFLDPDAREATLKKSHGLTIKGWETHLAKGLEEVPNLTVSLEQGTFDQLCEVTENLDRALVFRPPYPNRTSWKRKGSKDIPPGTKITIREVLSRIPELRDLFERTFDDYSDCLPTFVFCLSETTQTDISILATSRPLPEEARIRSSLQLSQNHVLSRAETHPLAGNVPNLTFRVLHQSIDDLFARIPLTRTDREGVTFMVSPLPTGVRLSPLSLLFILAYSMSMLVRYFPSQWSALIGKEKGDFVLPLLKASVLLVEEEFPRLVLVELEDEV